MIFAAGVGIPLGRYAARHAQGWSDGAVTVLSLVAISIPVFGLGLTRSSSSPSRSNSPAAGRIDPRANLTSGPSVLIDGLLRADPTSFSTGCYLILPAITLGSIPLAIIPGSRGHPSSTSPTKTT